MATSCVTRNRAFTLVEVLVGIAVVSTLASVGYVTVGNVREGARENKLQADVVTLNTAVQSYLGSGGSLPDNATADVVLAKLKTRAVDSVAAQTVGAVKGSFLDMRVEPDLQSGDEAGSSQLRAVWNAAQMRFVLSRDGAGGIKSFNLNNERSSEAPQTEDRTLNLAASDVTSGAPVWVWDYAENVATTPHLGESPGAGAGAGYTPVDPNEPASLTPPILSLAGGSYDVVELHQFFVEDQIITNLTSSGGYGVKVTNPNPQNVSSLSPGESLAVSANAAGETKSVKAVSLDPDVWEDSAPVEGVYTAKPFELEVVLTAPDNLTPFDVGVPPASGVAGSAAASASISNWGSIPAMFRVDGNIQLVMASGSQNVNSLSGLAQESVSIPLTTASGWDFSNGNPTMAVSVLAKAANSTLFTSDADSGAVTVSRPSLALTFTPGSGTILNASETITITPADASQFPADYTIRYTTDNSQPTASSGSVYNPNSPIIPTASGGITLKAAAFSASYSNWFTSTVSEATYTINAQSGDSIPAGALVSFANLQNNVQFHGSMMIAAQSPQQNITLFGNSRIVGNMYVPGTPEIYKDHVASSQWDNQLWSLPVDGNFSNYILGKQFDENGNQVIPATESASPRVINLEGDANPTNYRILIQDSAKVEGKIYRRSTPPPLPTVTNPGTKTNNVSRSYHSWTLNPSNPSRFSTTVNPAVNSGVSLTTNASLTLLPGNYGSVTASNNGRLVLGDANNPDNVQYYSFEQLQVSGGAGIEVVGKVVVTIKYGSTMRVDNTGFFGNSAHPDWLQLNVYSTAAPSQGTQHVLVASNSAFYGRINAPKGMVTIQENSIFNGAVTAYKLEMTGSAGANINFSLPPIVE